MGIYRFSMHSREERGSTKPNIMEVFLANDSDAALFKGNLELLCSAQCVSVTSRLSVDYSLPYPVGTDNMVRCAAFDGIKHWYNFRVFDIVNGFDVLARAPALIAAGFKWPTSDHSTIYTPTVINIAVFSPGPSI